jgi:Carboxypeptidase regulatory-like domain
MPQCLKSLVLAALVFSLGASRVLAQQVYATIHGTVTDSSGAVVPGAKVTALNTATGISTSAKTDGAGYYIFPQLGIGGPYTVDIIATGFQKFESTGLTLNLNDNRDVDANLQIGQSTQTVQVQATTVQVETSDTQLKSAISGEAIATIPLLGRDASQLEKTAPGVVESSDRFGSFSANGSQTGNNSFLLDGADFNDGPLQDQGVTVNPDALAEIDIVTSTLNPEFARNAGAVVNETLKSGSNALHGGAFYYYRDTFLNNGDYFSQPGQRPPFHQNLYGGTLGGPVIKNRLFFFLGYQGYRNRTGTTQQTPVLTPSQLAGDFTADQNQVTGGTNGTTGLSTNPIPFAIGSCAAGTPWNACSSGMLSPSSFNSIAANLVNKFVPAANVNSGGTSFYSFPTADTGAQDQGVIRADYHMSQNDSLWGSSIFESRPFAQSLPFLGATLPGFGMVNTSHTKIFNGSYTHTFNPSTLNELRANYFRFNYGDVEPQHAVLPSSVGFSINPQSSSSGLPFINILGSFALGFSPDGPQPRKDTNLSITDTFSKVLGAHNLKFGAIWEQFRVSNPFSGNNNGNFAFNGSGLYSSGDPTIDFFLGIPDTYAQGSGGFIDSLAYEYYAYAQDNWKVTSDFTLNYGIAWDVETPNATRQYGGIGIVCWQNSSVESRVFPGAPPGLLYPGDPGCNKYGGTTPKYDHFGPRVGFAWSPSRGPAMLLGSTGTHNFAIRGGFGLYYNRDAQEGQLQNLGDPPFERNSTGAAEAGPGLSPGFANPFADVAGNGSEPNPFPFTRPGPGAIINWNNFPALSLSAIAPNYNVPYTYNFNFNIQRALPSNMVLTIGYVGSLGHNLARNYEADPITAAGHAACLADPVCTGDRARIHLDYPQYVAQPATIPGSGGVPYFTSIGALSTTGASNYNALQVTLAKATSHGLFFNLAYTYSHGLDNSSGVESSGFNAGQFVTGENGVGNNNTPGFQYLSYGDSDYDARHRFIAYYDYQVPLLARMNDNRLINETLGGWHVSGITALQTGFPVTINQFGSYNSMWCDSSTYYFCADTPSTSTFKINSLSPRAPGHFWFDNSTFSSEPIGTYGNVKRNFFHGPGYNYSDLNLYKNFPLGGDKARYLQIRLEAYNAFNHANFGEPDGNFSDGPSLFGSITSVIKPAYTDADPQGGRAIQLAGKFYF